MGFALYIITSQESENWMYRKNETTNALYLLQTLPFLWLLNNYTEFEEAL